MGRCCPIERAVAALLLVIACHGAAGAAGEDACLRDSRCERHFRRGLRLAERTRYDEALTAYEAAAKIQETSLVLISAGRMQHRLGQPALALALYERARALGTPLDAAAKKQLEVFEREARAALPPPPPPDKVQPPPPPPPPPPSPKMMQIEVRDPRPKLRLGLGAAFTAAGLGLLGMGLAAPFYDGKCTNGSDAPQDPVACPEVYQALPSPGGWFLGVGAGLVVGGVVMLAIPGARRKVWVRAGQPGAPRN
jgi:hypothetical protein